MVILSWKGDTSKSSPLFIDKFGIIEFMKNVYRFDPFNIVRLGFIILLMLFLFMNILGPAYQAIERENKLMNQLLQKSAFISCDYLNESHETMITHIASCLSHQQTTILVVLDTDAKIIKRVLAAPEQIMDDLEKINNRYALTSKLMWVYKDSELIYRIETKNDIIYLNRMDLSILSKVRLYNE